MKKIREFTNILKPDFNTEKIPESLRYEASQWYFRISKFFSFLIFLGFLAVFLIGTLSLGLIMRSDFFGDGSLFHTFFTYSILAIMITGCVTIFIGNLYSYNRKIAMHSYIDSQIEILYNKYHSFLKEKNIEDIKHWNYLDLASKKKVIIQMYEKLSAQKKIQMQDDFLDLLNQKDIAWLEIPVVLLPTLKEGLDARILLIDRIEYLKEVYRAI